jgi:hypothetical protein
MAQVEARAGFVEQQHARSVRRFSAGELYQHPCEMRALLLAARQRGDHAVVEIAQIDLCERRLDQVVDSPSAAISRPHLHDLGDGERKGHADILRKHRPVQGQLARII